MPKVRLFWILTFFITFALFFSFSKLFRFANANSELVSYESVNVFTERNLILSEFHKKDINLKYALIFPKNYKDSNNSFPTIFHIPGYGGTHNEAYRNLNRIRDIENQNKDLKFIHIFLDPSFNNGHHGFVNSNLNGPMEDAFVKELLPNLQKKYKISTDTKKLFLTGHSSGAWSALWLILQNPEKFAGAWVSAPDPLDFQDFYGVDLRVGSFENILKTVDGENRIFYVLDRDNINSSNTSGFSIIESEVISDESRYTKKVSSGMAQKLYNRDTGELNQDTLREWEKFDISKLVSTNFNKYLPALKKIKIVTGTSDNFFLDKPTKLFCDKIEKLGINDACLFVPKRSHVNLYFPHDRYPKGLDQMFLEEMKKNFTE
jgi:hypothetical protein